MTTFAHRLAVGAEIEDGATRFRLWAPSARRVELCLEGRAALPMRRDRRGFAELLVPGVGAGERYRYRIDGRTEVPDPASRHQPAGVHGPSQVVDPRAHRWRHPEWRGRPWNETVLYELHVGTFTPAGTFAAAVERLEHLVQLGVTAIELMPLAQTPGAYNWGYDGVQLFAPAVGYGTPEDLKRLIDEAHGRGLMVFLDVVYNHFGPEGNYLGHYANDMFVEGGETPWGQAIAVDGPHRETVRRFFIDNALYWLEEYRFDGLRLDAINAIPHDSTPTFVEQLCHEVRAHIRDRHVHLVVENDDNLASLLERDDKGTPQRYAAQWNDDFHHALHRLVTGERDGYYGDYERPLERLGRCLAEGFVYQGEPSMHRRGRERGQPSAHLPPSAFVNYVQNHDQIGNRALGQRLHRLCNAPALEAAYTILLLAPSIPLIFMGEEWMASTPFCFFSDLEARLHDAVRAGRLHEFATFDEFRGVDALQRMVDPCAAGTMQRSQLRWEERHDPPHREVLERYRHLLTVRRREIAPRIERIRTADYEMDGDVLQVRWQLDEEVLGLTVRAVDASQRPPANVVTTGRTLAATANVTDELPAWGVRWWLQGERA